LSSRNAEGPLQYSWGMSEAARAKFHGNDSLTDRLKAYGQWSGTCSDFVQLGVEDLDARTIVCLMVMSTGDPNRQIRERVFSADKAVVGVACGSYKQSTGVSVTLCTKFVPNAPTLEAERQARGLEDQSVSSEQIGNINAATEQTLAAMHQVARAQTDDDATEEELERRRQQHLADLEAHRSGAAPPGLNKGKSVVLAHDEGDAAMEAIQRERLAALAALEKNNPYAGQNSAVDDTPSYSAQPARDLAYDPSIESYEEAEAKKRAFFEEQERQKREAIQKAEEARKNAWKAERAAREEARKREEEERLRKLQEGAFPRPVKTSASTTPFKSQPAVARTPASVPPPVNRQPSNVDQRSSGGVSEDMDELTRERMAKIAALEANNPYAGTASTAGVAAPYGGGGLLEPEAYDPTRETYEDAEARKRAFFEEQERQKREAVEKAEQARKEAWKAERAAREEARKREEAERLRRLQEEGPFRTGAPKPAATTAPTVRSVGAPTPVNRAVDVPAAHHAPPTSSYIPPTAGEDKDALSKEEERLFRAVSKHTGVLGRVDPAAAKEEERKKREAEAQERIANMQRLREEKWKAETLKAEQAAAARAAEAEAKARALAAGQIAPQEVAPIPTAADLGLAGLPPSKGDINQALQEIENCGAAPLTLYLNALIRQEESVTITSLADVRDGVTFYSSTGHKVHRVDKFHVAIAESEGNEHLVRIPPEHLLNDDFNTISDYFFFGTAEYLTLYPTADLNEAEVMHVSDLTTLSPGEQYYLPSGNFVVINGGANPQFLLNGEKEVALPEEVAESLRF
jgi:hypothetical protein